MTRARLAIWLGAITMSAPIQAADQAASKIDSVGWIVAALLGWTLSLLLVGYLVISQKRWRAAFETKEWLLLPSQNANEIVHGIGELRVHVADAAQLLSQRAEGARKASEATLTETQAAREEYRILREELEVKQKEIKALRLGHEFHARKPVLMRVIKALQVIAEDQTHNREPLKTLEGVMVELEECLQDNHVRTLEPALGVPIADAVGLDMQSARRQETDDPAKKGTVAEVERPAYVVQGPGGHNDVLVPARITVFV